jgi:hypothetical protein
LHGGGRRFESGWLHSTLTGFEVQFPPDQIRALASRYQYEDDPEVRAAGAAAGGRGHYTRQEFLVVCAWKTARSRPRVERNSEQSVREATKRAFAARDERARMEALLTLDGVGVPTASTLLHVAFPDDYPILDVRALESLGHRGRTTYPLSFWLGYLDACRRLAAEHAVSLRTLDKALWQYSKEAGR